MSNQRNDRGPTSEQLRAELERVRYRRKYASALRSTIYALIALATVVLLAVLWLPVYHVSGDSMEETLADGDIIVSHRGSSVERSDLAVIQCDDGKTLIKRVIAVGGDEVYIGLDGSVLVNGVRIDEPYAADRVRGECDVEMPLTVPEGHVFVLGDNREISMDSRSSELGCVPEEWIAGRVVMRVWPLQDFEWYLSLD